VDPISFNTYLLTKCENQKSLWGTYEGDAYNNCLKSKRKSVRTIENYNRFRFVTFYCAYPLKGTSVENCKFDLSALSKLNKISWLYSHWKTNKTRDYPTKDYAKDLRKMEHSDINLVLLPESQLFDFKKMLENKLELMSDNQLDFGCSLTPLNVSNPLINF